MNPVLALALSVLSASAVLFLAHKFAADHLPRWLSEHMTGVEIKRPPYGWEVVFPATLTSLEFGVALLLAYILLRRSTPSWSIFARAICLTLLCLALGGNLLRMPLMQLVVGNPLGVTLVQHLAVWLPYLAACLTLAYVYEWITPHAA